MRTHVRLAAVLAVVVPAATAGAWGPRARLAIVDTATHILAREERIPLNNLERSILDGASVPAGALTTLCPHAETDPIRAIEAEMGLLQRMYRGRVDPYLAFRLGVLGKLVAQVSAPMATAGATYGNLYYADADTQITGVSLQPSARREVEPLGYFRGVQQAATANDEAIVRDYKRGVGFDGVAKGAFAAHANRSVDAVADVWHTILTQRVKLTNVPDARIRAYMIGALEYYLKRNNRIESERAYRRLVAEASPSPELREQIGDMFYDAGEYERAMSEYRAVVADHPERTDVVEKISTYYESIGDAAVAQEKLEDASELYAKARDANPLNIEARKKLRDTEGRLRAREDRLAEASATNERAASLENEAQREALRGNLGKAMELLAETERLYGGVSEEFPSEHSAASIGLRNVATQQRQLKGQLILQAQGLSGSGVSGESGQLAKSAAEAFNKEALRAVLGDHRRAAARQLEQELLERTAEPGTR